MDRTLERSAHGEQTGRYKHCDEEGKQLNPRMDHAMTPLEKALESARAIHVPFNNMIRFIAACNKVGVKIITMDVHRGYYEVELSGSMPDEAKELTK